MFSNLSWLWLAKTLSRDTKTTFSSMSSPAFMLVNHDGQDFPEIYRQDGDEVSKQEKRLSL